MAQPVSNRRHAGIFEFLRKPDANLRCGAKQRKLEWAEGHHQHIIFIVITTAIISSTVVITRSYIIVSKSINFEIIIIIIIIIITIIIIIIIIHMQEGCLVFQTFRVSPLCLPPCKASIPLHT